MKAEQCPEPGCGKTAQQHIAEVKALAAKIQERNERFKHSKSEPSDLRSLKRKLLGLPPLTEVQP